MSSNEKKIIQFAKEAQEAGMSYGEYQAKMFMEKQELPRAVSSDEAEKKSRVLTSHSKTFY